MSVPTIVDVITRTKNRPLLLRRCLESLLSQNYVHWHWVVVNNGEAGPVESLLRENAEALAGRVTLIAFLDRGLLGKLTNVGIAGSGNPLITLLDDDDTWHPRFLEATVPRLTSDRLHDSVRGVCTLSNCIHEKVDADGRISVIKEYPFNPHLRNIHLASLAAVNQFPPNAFVYERRALGEVGGYNEDLPVLDDWDFNLRFNFKFNIDVVYDGLSNYHLRPDTKVGEMANTVTAKENLHRFYEGVILNQHLRADLAQGRMGLGTLLAIANTRRVAESLLHTQRKKLEHMSDKIGKINARTQMIKSKLP